MKHSRKGASYMFEDFLDLIGLGDGGDDDLEMYQPVSTGTPVDLDEDGIMDGFLFQSQEDYNEEGIFEASGEFMDTDEDGIMEPIDQYSPFYYEESGAAPAYETFDPSRADLDSIVGDPAGNMENWHWQETGTRLP